MPLRVTKSIIKTPIQNENKIENWIEGLKQDVSEKEVSN